MGETKGKHTMTQGPWKIGFGGMADDTFATITSDFAEYPICQLEPRGYSQANAQLIAASRELYDAAECAYSILFLLRDEVQALGCRGAQVREKLWSALYKANPSRIEATHAD